MKKKPKAKSKHAPDWRKNLLKGRLLYQLKTPSKIRLSRIERDISQAEIARRLGLSPAAYGDIERGATPVKPERAGVIAQMLGQGTCEMFGPCKNRPGKLLAISES